jgi:L-ascorbate metabolism protein UlaG (beta-lactamase superfamily)
MNVRWLGWAGVEIEAQGASVVIDPLEDVRAVFAPLGEAAAGMAVPTVVAPSRTGGALAGLVTHLHRDHADAAALVAALAAGAPVLRPAPGGGGDLENLALAAAEHELAAAGLQQVVIEPWAVHEVGPFAITALPAADGLGDPQVSWLVEADGARVVHLGDTINHGYWWRMALRHGPFDLVLAPVNAARIRFPHRRPASPLPAALDPEQAAMACEILGARLAVPIHHDGYVVDGIYEPIADAGERFLAAAEGRPFAARLLRAGESLELAPVVAAA